MKSSIARRTLRLCWMSLSLVTVGAIAAEAAPFAYVAGGNVSVIDTATNTVVATVPVSGTEVAITPDGAFAYVAASRNVSVIDTATNTVVATVPVDESLLTRGVAITPDGAFAYVTNPIDLDSDSNSVSVIDTATNTVVATVPLGYYVPRKIAITPNGSFAYVATSRLTFEGYADGYLSVIDTATNTVAREVWLGFIFRGSYYGTSHVAFTPDGAFVYVTGSGSVAVIATATYAVVATVNGPAAGVAITPDGAFAYVVGTTVPSSEVWVIDTATNRPVARVPVGGSVFPRGVAITPDGAFAYVAEAAPGAVWVIATATNTVVDTVPVGGLGVAITPF